jgi:hypothetical protein
MQTINLNNNEENTKSKMDVFRRNMLNNVDEWQKSWFVRIRKVM